MKESFKLDHVITFKKVIEHFRKRPNVFIGVREKTLTDILNDAGVHPKYRPFIFKELQELNLLEINDKRASMKYRWIEKEIKTDSSVIAENVYDRITNIIPPPRILGPRKQKIPTEKLPELPPVIKTKEFVLHDIVVFLRDNKIYQGEIIGSRFSKSFQPEPLIDYSKILYDIVVTSNGDQRGVILQDVDKAEIFSSIDILFQVLRIQYNNSILINITKK